MNANKWDNRFYVVDDRRNERVDPDFKSGNERYYRVRRKQPKKLGNFMGNLENEF